MKKFLSLILAVLFAYSLNAQVTEAQDFIATDYFGNEIHLYEILEGGQYVLMHINTRTNAATPKVTPPLVEAYKRLGCNQHDVFFIGVVPNGTTNVTKKYVDEYGIEFPMIHNTDESNGMQGPAMDIWQTYQCEQPATMLIAPDKSIVFDDINTIETSDDVVSALAEYGIQEYECDGNDDNNDDNNETEAEQYRIKDINSNQYLHIFNNNSHVDGPIGGVGVAAYAETNAQIFTIEDAGNGYVYLHSADDKYIVCRKWNVDACNNSEKSALNMIDNGDGTFYLSDPYFVNDKENNYFKVQNVEGANYVFCDAPIADVATWVLEAVNEEPEEVGTSVIDLQAEVLSETTVRIIATPNAETVVYHYIVLTKSDADEMGHEETMQLLYADEFPLTEVDDWTWQGLAPGTTYYAIAQGKNRNEEWGEITKIEFTTIGDGLVEFANSTFKVYPNPASDYINITSEISGEAEVNIFDMTGRCVKNTRINDINNATINISDIEKGVYFVNINGKVMKLVVK